MAIFDMPFDEYLAHPGVSRGVLWELHTRSALHAKHAYDTRTAGRADTPALAFGRALHLALLEPDRAFDMLAVAPDVDRRTKIGKETWADFVAENAGKTIVSLADYDAIKGIMESVQAHDEASELLGQADRSEGTIIWTDANTGIQCKARPDRLIGVVVNNEPILDIKTCQDSSPRAFAYSVAKYGYAVQAEHYRRAVASFEGHKPDFYFVAVEKTPPYAVGLYQIEKADLMAAGILIDAALATWARCVESGHWPSGYRGTLSVPFWSHGGADMEELDNE